MNYGVWSRLVKRKLCTVRRQFVQISSPLYKACKHCIVGFTQISARQSKAILAANDAPSRPEHNETCAQYLKTTVDIPFGGFIKHKRM